MKKLNWIMMLTGMMVILGACAKDNTSADSTQASSVVMEKAEDGILTVGFDQDFPPMGFVGEDGEFTGFDLELATETAKRLGMEVKYQPIAWDAKDMELETGNIDCVWNGFTMNGREESYTWSMPYMENAQVYVVKKDSGITTVMDLAGKKVEVQADSSAEAALKDQKEVLESFGEFLTTPDYNTAFMDLEMGAVDAIAMDVIVAGYQIAQRKDNDFIILEESIASENYGVGFKKGNEALRDKVDTILKEMAEDGTLKSISEKWFGKDITIVGK